MNDFERINTPRAEKLTKALKIIVNSAKSNKATSENVADLLARHDFLAVYAAIEPFAPARRSRLEGTPGNTSAGTASQPEPKRGPQYTPPINRELEALSKRSTQQLVDIMITCGALLAERRQ